MVKRYSASGKPLEALLRAYAPPRKLRVLNWSEEEEQQEGKHEVAAESNMLGTNASAETGSNTAIDPERVSDAEGTAATDSRESSQGRQWESTNDHGQVITQSESESRTPDKKRRRLEARKQSKRRWVGTVVEALSDVFTAIWANYVEPTTEFQASVQVHPGTCKPGTDAKLVSRIFSAEKLMASRESFRIQYEVMQAFAVGNASLPDWDINPAVAAYMKFLKADAMIRECCQGLFARLNAPQFEQVDEFVNTLKQVWFQPVLCGGKKPRCGYHHVCIGDFSTAAKVLSGMHNWFKFLIEEEMRRTRILNWFSYQRDLHLVSMSFSMKHPSYNVWYTKPRSSFLVGVPTDFELLLFTVITMVNPNQDTSVQIKHYEPLLVVPRSRKKTGNVVTAYFRESPKENSDD